MNVGDLKKLLEPLQDDVIVVLSKDAEGNGYSPLRDTYLNIYVPDTTWFGDVYVGRFLTPELEENGFTEEDMYDGDDGKSAIVLYPTN